MNLDRLTKSLKQEFLCYYHADLIPDNWKSKNVTNELAQESVARLTNAVKQKGDLVDLLKILVENRSHPINEMLSEETDIEWSIEDEDWFGYKALLEEMIKILEQ